MCVKRKACSSHASAPFDLVIEIDSGIGVSGADIDVIRTQPHPHHDPDALHSLVDLHGPVQRLQLVPRRSSGSRRPRRTVFVPLGQAYCRRGSAFRHSGDHYGTHRPPCVLGAHITLLRA